MRKQGYRVNMIGADGVSAGYCHGHKRTSIAKREIIQGWSKQTSRSNTRALQQMNSTQLLKHRIGWAITLTLKDCPTANDYIALREKFFKRLRRRGLIGCHWLTEWQERGVPHLHLSVFFKSSNIEISPQDIINQWLIVAADYTVSSFAQSIKQIVSPEGWRKYLSKHGARGLGHYQRAAKSIPASWRGASTGRMWGILGDMCLSGVIAGEIGHKQFHVLRRALYRYARAVSSKKLRHHKFHKKEKSSVLLGFSCWFKTSDAKRILAAAM